MGVLTQPPNFKIDDQGLSIGQWADALHLREERGWPDPPVESTQWSVSVQRVTPLHCCPAHEPHLHAPPSWLCASFRALCVARAWTKGGEGCEWGAAGAILTRGAVLSSA